MSNNTFNGIEMPQPWFRGQTAEFTIMHGLEVVPQYGGFVIPEFQRGLVWTEEQKIKFIESIWMELPIGVYVYNEDVASNSQYHLWLLDGQQRWDAIYSYAKDEFEVFGAKYSGLSEADNRRFNHRTFTARVTRYKDEELLREIFERLAYGGTPNERS